MMRARLLREGSTRQVRSSDSSASRWLTSLGIGVAAGLLLLGTVASLSARRDARLLAERQSDNLLLTLKRDIARNVAVFDLSLQGAIEASAEPGLGSVSAGIRRHALFDRAAGAEDLGAIVLLDPVGDVTESSRPLPRGLNFAGREEFTAQRERADVGLFIGHPIRSWFDDDQASLWLSRRLPDVDGRFAGVVAGALRLTYFKQVFERLEIGPLGSILLLRTDGRVVWRYPAVGGIVDQDLAGSAIVGRMNAANEGRGTNTSPIDGVERSFTFGRVGTLPLIVSVNIASEDIYARWRQKAAIIGSVLGLICLAIVMLSLLFRREIARREAAERALGEAARELSDLAATDGLTGLPNRRTFEEGFERDWRRALRLRERLSLLMVDVDHFKRFNDHYGHQDGDRALQRVAAAIRSSLPSRSASVSRYGGEEFVVLLPDCDTLAARLVAERLRVAVEDLGITHTQSASGKVTVSVGVATAQPEEGDDRAGLIDLADRRLYAAKREGRNLISPGLPDAPPRLRVA